ncbi:MAG: hypothetical protein B7733_05760 [Myxococcales bacterium FL481]|nr:MAG: hypothetical protein B7733_05760 [Myxococcales bacterium FL481]
MYISPDKKTLIIPDVDALGIDDYSIGALFDFRIPGEVQVIVGDVSEDGTGCAGEVILSSAQWGDVAFCLSLCVRREVEYEGRMLCQARKSPSQDVCSSEALVVRKLPNHFSFQVGAEYVRISLDDAKILAAWPKDSGISAE